MTGKVMIRKENGDSVPFDREKLRTSLERSGAGEDLIMNIILTVESRLEAGMRTREIYRLAFDLLRRKSKPSAARYKLRDAILELGPTGYPFEQFVGALLRHQGYDVKVGVVIRGRCASHEVDVVAERESRRYLVECKFHSDFFRKCTIQVPLYIRSRFVDLQEGHKREGVFQQGWIVTNTRFTADAIEYGKCAGLRLIGWNYPDHGSLKERIDTSNLHPVTCLTSLRKAEKEMLLKNDIVLCMQVAGPEVLDRAGIDKRRHRAILREVNDFMDMPASR